VVEKREEFEDLDIVVSAKDIHRLKRESHWRVRPFKLEHEGEEILVTFKDIIMHHKVETQLLKVSF
jgi:ribosomal protein L25 (general stress protein Ctc)